VAGEQSAAVPLAVAHIPPLALGAAQVPVENRIAMSTGQEPSTACTVATSTAMSAVRPCAALSELDLGPVRGLDLPGDRRGFSDPG
jgi:hypothetical protein